MPRITDDQERLELLPSLFGPDFLRVETMIYDRAQWMCPEYKGAYWHMNTEPFYMSPAMRAERVKVEVPSNGYSGEMSPEALGIVCSLFVLNGLCWKYPDSTKYNKMFYDLRHWALEKHPEALEICGAID